LTVNGGVSSVSPGTSCASPALSAFRVHKGKLFERGQLGGFELVYMIQLNHQNTKLTHVSFQPQ